jgi:DNA-directed RNA polymerase subunit M/transcription elongation factor TFIIS
MPARTQCVRCHHVGFVRVEMVVRARDAQRHYDCNRCGYAWVESTAQPRPNGADRRHAKTDLRRTPRTERRSAQHGSWSDTRTLATPRIDCPYCGRIGSLYPERVIQGPSELTTYFCESCHAEWDEREGAPPPATPRRRLPKTRRDKQSEA